MKIKYAWLKYMNLIYGESEYNEKHVLVLPKMEQISSSPIWLQGDVHDRMEIPNMTNEERDSIYDDLEIERMQQQSGNLPVSLMSLLKYGIPSRYRNLGIPDEYFEDDWGSNTRDSMELFRVVDKYNLNLGKEISYWIKKFISFFNTHPEFENENNFFDFGRANTMRYNGQYVLTDPLA